MNSFNGSASQRNPSSSYTAAVSFNSYKFDFGTGSNNSSSSARPLRDQKLNQSPTSSNPLFSSSSSSPAAASWSPSSAARPSWTHQPATASARSSHTNPSPSMVGDIFGRNWSAAAAPVPVPAAAGLCISDKNPNNLFSDLVGSAIGQSRSAQNIPLKYAPPKDSFSMTGIYDSIPKSNNSTASASTMGGFSSFNQPGSRIGAAATGAPMKSAAGAAMNSGKTDPFGSLTAIASKPSSNVPLSARKISNFSSGSGSEHGPFGAFQNAKTSQKPHQSSGREDFSFRGFQNAKMNEFGMPASSSSLPQKKPTQAASEDDQLDVLISSTPSSTAPCGASSKSQPFSEMNDWDIEFGGHENGGSTIELEGIPPPPAGVIASAAKSKGLDNYKQGQFADAIKWLSWAVVLLEKSGDEGSCNEVLVCRASSYKEVGEYKKAIADCSKLLDRDSTNVYVLLQRALLYESSEKYRLGAEDLRAVLRIDPGNRLARSTIHRLNQFTD